MPSGGSAAQTFTTLHSFGPIDPATSANVDGASPNPGLALSGNTLYGTCSVGGAQGGGTVFKINTDGTGFLTLLSFNGDAPEGGLVLSGNALYGTTSNGGDFGAGSLFRLNSDGTQFTNLYSFLNGDDGANPAGQLLLVSNVLYGTAFNGALGSGTLFRMQADGTGFTNLYSFSALDANGFNGDGFGPAGGLVLVGNTLYGTAPQGGSAGNGTVFKFNLNTLRFSALHTFAAVSGSAYTNSDGASPQPGLVVIGGTLFGTTGFGGSAGFGILFRLNTDGTGFTTLYNFTGGAEGAVPQGGLAFLSNSIAGAAQGGGLGSGTLFFVGTNGAGFSNLRPFSQVSGPTYTNSDGAQPNGNLVWLAGSLYGTAAAGGLAGSGTVFALTTSSTTNPNNVISGYLTDGNKNPVASIHVYATNSTGVSLTNTTDATGYYSFAATDGFWDVSVDCAELSARSDACVSDQSGLVCCGGTLQMNFITCGQALQITTTDLPPASAGAPYDFFLQALDCNSSLSWSVSEGTLPPGMQLQSSGELSGTPTVGGVFSFTAQVVDGLNNSTSEALTLVAVPPSVTITLGVPSVSGGGLQFALNGQAGQNVTVQVSTNLVDWSNLAVSNLANTSLVLRLLPGTNSCLFYRAYQSGLVVPGVGGVGGPAPVLSFSAPRMEVNVTNGAAHVTVIRSGNLSNQVCIAYATSDLTAAGGLDYLPSSGTLCFAPFEVSNSFVIPLLLNANTTTAVKSIGVHLFPSNGSNVLNGEVAINYPSYICFQGSSYAANAVDGGAQIAVVRFGDLSSSSSAYVTMTDGTARAGIDYSAANGYVYFPPGAQTASFQVTMLPDSTTSSNLTVNLHLAPSGNNSALTSPSNSVLVINQGSVFQFSSANYSANLSSTNVVFSVTRRGKTNGTASVQFATLDDSSCIPGYGSSDYGNQTTGGDYISTNGTLIFAPGVTNASFAVALISLATNLADGFTVALSNPSGNAGLGSPAAAALVMQRPAPVPSITSANTGYTLFAPSGGCTALTIITISNAGPVGSILPYNVASTYPDQSQLLTLNSQGGYFTPYKSNAQCSPTNGYVLAGGSVNAVCMLNMAYLDSLTAQQQFNLGNLVIPIGVNGKQEATIEAFNVARILAGEWHGSWFTSVPPPACLNISVGGTWSLQFDSFTLDGPSGVGTAATTFAVVGSDYFGGGVLATTNCPYSPFELNAAEPITVPFVLVGCNGSVHATVQLPSFIPVNNFTNPAAVGADLWLNVLSLQVEKQSQLFVDPTRWLISSNVVYEDISLSVNGTK